MPDNASDRLQTKRRASLARIDKIAYWLDDAYRIPVIGKRIGIDGILGFLPFAGDFVGMAMSSLMIGEAVRLGAPKKLWLRMGANVGIDFVVGLVPVVGDVFDIFFKANRRNQTLMQRWLNEATGTEPPSSPGPGMASIVACLGLAAIVSLGLWQAVFG